MASGKPVPTLTAATVAKLRASIDLVGLASVANACGCSAESITRALAGLPIRAGTVLLIERGVGT